MWPPQRAKNCDDRRREGRAPKGGPSDAADDPGGEGDGALLAWEPIKMARERKIGGHCGDGFVAIVVDCGGIFAPWLIVKIGEEPNVRRAPTPSVRTTFR